MQYTPQFVVWQWTVDQQPAPPIHRLKAPPGEHITRSHWLAVLLPVRDHHAEEDVAGTVDATMFQSIDLVQYDRLVGHDSLNFGFEQRSRSMERIAAVASGCSVVADDRVGHTAILVAAVAGLHDGHHQCYNLADLIGVTRVLQEERATEGGHDDAAQRERFQPRFVKIDVGTRLADRGDLRAAGEQEQDAHIGPRSDGTG